jgi:hypothetical protein
MREICQSGSEGGARSIPRPYPYQFRSPFRVLPMFSQDLIIHSEIRAAAIVSRYKAKKTVAWNAEQMFL